MGRKKYNAYPGRRLKGARLGPNYITYMLSYVSCQTFLAVQLPFIRLLLSKTDIDYLVRVIEGTSHIFVFDLYRMANEIIIYAPIYLSARRAISKFYRLP